MTYTPPPRKNRRKGYENNVKYTQEVQDSICCTSEMGFQTDEELPQLEPALQPTTDAEEDITSWRDKKENYGRQKRAGSDTDFPSIIPADLNCGEYSECFDRPVTESVMDRSNSPHNSADCYSFLRVGVRQLICFLVADAQEYILHCIQVCLAYRFRLTPFLIFL